MRKPYAKFGRLNFKVIALKQWWKTPTGSEKGAEFKYSRVGCDWDVAQTIEWTKAMLREACGGINEAAHLEIAEDGKERMTELISAFKINNFRQSASLRQV
jgi:hypothetical protein